MILIKEKPGNASLEKNGRELAQFIEYVNNKKRQNYPNEDWETIVTGYSKGGQVSRYALMLMEKEHMENGGPHHHTRLYIPFDSPHHGASIPLFAQSVYFEFWATNLIAALAYMSLTDPASSDMSYYSINASTGGLNNGTLNPFPHQYAVNYQNELENNFSHFYNSNITDTRKTFPIFTRNIAVATGSYKDNYTTKWGLDPGKHLFKQNALTYNLLLGAGGLANRHMYASEYSTNQYKTVFKRRDFYIGFFLFFIIDKEYKFKNAYEFDMAQGGYKNNFYDDDGGPIGILRSSTFGVGTKYYFKKTGFLPLVSAFAIKPSIWENNNLGFNMQNQDMFIIGQDNQGQDIITNNFGYPHYGHPIDHFEITPFEAVYADIHTYDHIVMSASVAEFSNEIGQFALNGIRDFLNDEVEAWNFPLQNKIIGENHVIDPNYEYKAWYKARGSILIGHEVTPRTDPGDYIIQSTGNITVHARESVHIQPGFHTQAGSTFHAFIYYDGCGLVFNKSSNNSGTTNSNASIKETNLKSKNASDFRSNRRTVNITIFPNPNSGKFTLKVNKTNYSGNLFVYSTTGKLVYKQQINSPSTQLSLGLEKGVYYVLFNTDAYSETVKMIIQ